MKFTSLILNFIFLSSSAFGAKNSATRSLSVHVVPSQASVHVQQISGSKPYLVADFQGDKTFSSISQGNYVISASLTGYVSQSKTVNVPRSGSAQVSISLVASTPSTPPPSAPTVSLVASPTSINQGSSSVLSWNSTNAISCSASGSSQFSGAITLSGSVSVSPTTTTTYSISCTGAGGSANMSAQVSVQASATSPSPVAPTYACLNNQSVQTVMGSYTTKYTTSAVANKSYDARAADWLEYNIDHGVIVLEGSSTATNMCWAGGYVRSNKAWDTSWAGGKDIGGPTQNNAGIDSRDGASPIVTGMHMFNIDDAFRESQGAQNFLVQHSFTEYVRDDCLENDHYMSGTVYDTLFDGCYSGISTRPSSADTVSTGAGSLVTLDSILLRMEPSPYPYEWDTRPSQDIGVDGLPWDGTGIPYGYGNIFKLDSNVSRNGHWALKNSVFLVSHFITSHKLDFPDASLVDQCENVTIIYLGKGSYSGYLPTAKFPNCFTILTGQQGLDFWKAKVQDWFLRHPNVDPTRQPANPGSFVFPRQF